MDLQAAVNAEVIPWLHSNNAANLVWWTEAQLYQWLDHMAHKLSREALLFVEANTNVTITAGTMVYAAPERHIATLYVAAGSTDGDGPHGLNPANIEELEALSYTWPTDEGDRPERFVHDIGLDMITFHPGLLAGRPDYNVTMVIARHLEEITASNFEVDAPEVLRPLFALHALAEAMGHDGEGRMIESERAIRPLLGLLNETVRGYFS